ncbi:MAG: tetratricopeptide repeat protein [Ignavibacteriaceae bacterium]
MSSNFVFPQTYPDSAVNDYLRTGIREIINQNYEAASNNFKQLDNKFSNLPLGKIYLATVEIAKSYDLGEDFKSNYIIDNLRAAKEQSEKLLEKDKDNIWYNYFLSLSEGYSAYFSALNKSWFTAFSEGLSARSDFEKCVKIDSNFYDAYIAIGAYKYWKSRKTEFLKWLPFMNDEEQSGINLLKTAINHPSYNTYLAINSLTWIYIDQHSYNQAAKLSQEALKKFPDNRLFKWGLARAYEDIDKNISIKIYKEILDSYTNISNQNRYKEIVLKHIIAQLYQKIGDKQKALMLCDDILSINNLSDNVKEKLVARLKRVRELRDELAH